jgi:hypothetical protein
VRNSMFGGFCPVNLQIVVVANRGLTHEPHLCPPPPSLLGDAVYPLRQRRMVGTSATPGQLQAPASQIAIAPNVPRMWCAPCTSRVRRYGSPYLLIWSCCRSMTVSWKPMRCRRAAFHVSSGAGPLHRATVSEGTAEPGGRTGACARPGVDHRSGFHVRHEGRYAGPAGLLRQQSKLRDCGGAGHGGENEPGNRGRAGHANTFRAMARTRARIGGGRHDLRERGVPAVVGGAEHHSLHASSGQCPQ